MGLFQINEAEVIIHSIYWLISARVFNVAPKSNQRDKCRLSQEGANKPCRKITQPWHKNKVISWDLVKLTNCKEMAII
jgi:hypothetical protein